MSSSTPSRRPQMQRIGLVGIGTAVLLVGMAPAAGAATDVTIALEPTEVELHAFPVENVGAHDPMADRAVEPTVTPVPVQYSGTITVDLPAQLDDSAVEAELQFDDDGDGVAEATYSSSVASTDPYFLAVTGQGTGSIQVTLPADDPVVGDAAALILAPLTSTLSPAFTYYDPVFYALQFDGSASAAVTVTPELVALSQVPCALSSSTRCAVPTAVTAGSTVTLDLTAGSVLRELGLTDLTGVQVGLAPLDADGVATGPAVELATTQVTETTASFLLPADTAAGSYGLVVAQQPSSGGVSIVYAELTVVAEAVVAPPTAEPPTAEPVVNDGLRSNTGVEAVEAGSTANLAVAAGAGMLLLAGAGGVAVARNRRRPAAEGGTCEV